MYSKRNYGLDAIRVIAISLVVLSHCTYFFVQESENAFILLTRALGAIGVDLFFILSGYLIGGILLKNIKDGKRSFSDLISFWKRRWFRTLPNYFLVLLLNIFLALLLDIQVPEKIGTYFLFLQNFETPHPMFFTEAWSLSIEEYAYLFLPFIFYLAFLLLKKGNEKMFFRITLTAIGALYLVKVFYFLNANVDSYKEWSSGFRKVVIYRLDSIYLGFLLVYFINTFQKHMWKIKNVLLCISLILFFAIHYLIFKFHILPHNNLEFYVFIYLLIVGVSCGLAFPFFIHFKRSNNQFISKTIYFISTRSYAIYLINYSVLLLNIQQFTSYDRLSFSGRILIVSLFLVCTGVFSQILYKYFEKPIMDLRDKKWFTNRSNS